MTDATCSRCRIRRMRKQKGERIRSIHESFPLGYKPGNMSVVADLCFYVIFYVLKRFLHFDFLEGFYEVAFADIVVALDRQTAVVTGNNFLDIVFEAFE